MGKRKSRRKAPARAAAPKLEHEFDCPFCCSIKSVGIAVKRKELTATLSCRVCNVIYECNCSPLDEPIDVFSNWIDSCEEVNAPTQAPATGINLALSGLSQGNARPLDFSASRAVQQAKRARPPAKRVELPPPKKKARQELGSGSEEDEFDFQEGEEEEEEVAFEDSPEQQLRDDVGEIEVEEDDFNETQEQTSKGGGGRLQKKKGAWDSDED